MHLFFIDERCVPKDDDDNNFKACFNAWLNDYPEIKYYRIEVWGDLKSASMRYEEKIKSILDFESNIPSFDLIFLGIGEDGHIASLFPENDFSIDRQRLVEKIHVKSKKINRISMTLKLLNNAKNRIIGVSGEKKKKIFQNLDNPEYQNLPVAKLCDSKSIDTWVIN